MQVRRNPTVLESRERLPFNQRCRLARHRQVVRSIDVTPLALTIAVKRLALIPLLLQEPIDFAGEFDRVLE
jgi:hypothetical protein